MSDLFKKEEANTVAEEDLSQMPKTAFTQEQLEKVWTEYSKIILEQKKRSIAATLQYRMPTLEENFKVSFLVENEIQKNYFTTEIGPLLNHLRTKLNNWSIALDIAINTSQDGSHKVKTDSERLQDLMESNESIRDLIKRLDLDWD